MFSFYKVYGPHHAVLYGRYDDLLDLPSLNHFFIGQEVVPYKFQPGNVNYELAYSCIGIVDYLEELGARAGGGASSRQRLEAAFDAIAAHEETLAARLLEMQPRMSKVFFCNSGSEANDTQLKVIRYYNNLRGKREKKKILSRKAAYHGVTLGATSLSGLPPMHAIFDLPLPGFFHLERPSHYWHAKPGMSEEEFSGQLAADGWAAASSRSSRWSSSQARAAGVPSM